VETVGDAVMAGSDGAIAALCGSDAAARQSDTERCVCVAEAAVARPTHARRHRRRVGVALVAPTQLSLVAARRGTPAGVDAAPWSDRMPSARSMRALQLARRRDVELARAPATAPLLTAHASLPLAEALYRRDAPCDSDRASRSLADAVRFAEESGAHFLVTMAARLQEDLDTRR